MYPELGATPTSSDDPKYPLPPPPLPLASSPNEDNPIALPLAPGLTLKLCDPLGLSKGGVGAGLVARLASRDTPLPLPRRGRSGNGRTLGLDDRAGDEPYREWMVDEVGVWGREYDRARFEKDELGDVGMTRGQEWKDNEVKLGQVYVGGGRASIYVMRCSCRAGQVDDGRVSNEYM